MVSRAVRVPSLHRRHVRRPRLTRRLDQSRSRLILFVAPAGYGKTSLECEWLESDPEACWLRCTSALADVAAFSVALAEAVGHIAPSAADRLRQRLTVPDSPEAAVRPLAEMLAEELAQDAFLRLFERFDEVTNPAGFLRTVVVRLCLTWQKRRTTEQRVARRVGVEAPSNIPEVDETWAALGRLDPDRRAVLVLRYYCQLRHHEIAELLGCPAATVRTRTHRALRDLRKELAR